MTGRKHKFMPQPLFVNSPIIKNTLIFDIPNIPPLLENMLFTLVIYDFQHWLLTDVESIIVNIGFKKLMLT